MLWALFSPHVKKGDNSYVFCKTCSILTCQHDILRLVDLRKAKFQLFYHTGACYGRIPQWHLMELSTWTQNPTLSPVASLNKQRPLMPAMSFSIQTMGLSKLKVLNWRGSPVSKPPPTKRASRVNMHWSSARLIIVLYSAFLYL